LFDRSLLAPHACVIAVGPHERDARELDDTVFRRATAVVVEDVATALREAGDVVLAIGAGALVADDLIALDELSSLDRTPGISVVKSVGVGWQDLAVAAAAYHRSGS
jgi:ornithine cyclodeaminase/alanine dehydrogenase-like protein (mu-crystallin family)